MATAKSDTGVKTDGDRVVGLIRRRGGQIWQQTITEETGWSEAKVSMVVGDLVEDGRVDKLRIGRQNRLAVDGQGELEFPW